jgi:hypothetical protein
MNFSSVGKLARCGVGRARERLVLHKGGLRNGGRKRSETVVVLGERLKGRFSQRSSLLPYFL